jgi:hypothetical protein
MTQSPCLPVEIVDVAGIEVMEDGRKIASGSFQKQVVVVGHQTEAVDSSSVAFRGGSEIVEKFLVVVFGLEDRSPLITTRGDMVESAGEFNPERSCHGNTLPRPSGYVNSVDLTPVFQDETGQVHDLLATVDDGRVAGGYDTLKSHQDLFRNFHGPGIS